MSWVHEPVDGWGLDPRTINALKRNGVIRAEELLTLTDEQLLGFDGVSSRRLKAIRAVWAWTPPFTSKTIGEVGTEQLALKNPGSLTLKIRQAVSLGFADMIPRLIEIAMGGFGRKCKECGNKGSTTREILQAIDLLGK